MPRESIPDYVARKKAKGVWGEPKPDRWKGHVVLTGQCPCPDCGHKGSPMLECDPDYNNCRCCHEVCS